MQNPSDKTTSRPLPSDPAPLGAASSGHARSAAARSLHGEYKIPGGKLLVIDMCVQDSALHNVQLSGDFFLEPPEALDTINAALEGLPADIDAAGIERAVNSVLGPGVFMYGITTKGIAVVVQRALDGQIASMDKQ